ncbi:carbohydrate binding domain-containing protein [Bifidobacterium adolescentis]|uniref:carbohydrate binding domain-containing protein n=1 Tax=Bifidobacterium adolescentis TaxID=1680 RepID=UPI0034A1A9D4
MKSFALWCDAKNAGESTGVKVLMNFNLWAEAEKGESHTVLDVGVMLIPEEKSSKRKQICEVVKSISFYCPFPLEKKNFENLFPKMDNKTVGAIFNSPCNYTKNDIYSVGYVTLYGDDAYPKFAICSCDNVQFEEIDDKGTIVKIMLTNTMFPPESDREYEPIYYRFRLSGMFVSNLVASSHSKDWLLTSAFSREEVTAKVNYQANGKWSGGAQQMEASCGGWYRYTIPDTAGGQVRMAFTDGGSAWDNNGGQGKDYRVSGGSVAVAGGQMITDVTPNCTIRQ